jgi:hypothetical protein
MKFKGNSGSLVNWSVTRDETAWDSCSWDGALQDTNMTSRKKMAAALPHQQLQHSPKFFFVCLFVRFSWLFALFYG